MKRLFWLAVGVGIGAIVVRKLARKASTLTPRGLVEQAKQQATGLGARAQAFAEDVRQRFAERENELHEVMLGGHDGLHESESDVAEHGLGGRARANGIDPDAAARFATDPDARWRD